MRPLMNITCAALICLVVPAFAKTLGIETSKQYSGNSFDWMLSDEFIADNLVIGWAGDREALEVLARLLRTGDARAATALQNYIKRYPNDPAAYDLAGTDLLRGQNYATAVQAFAKATELDPQAPWVRAKLGAALILAGRTDQGIVMMKSVILTDPDNPLALRYLSWDALQEGDAGRAIIHAERALNAFGLPQGQINSAHLDLAQLYHRTGQYDRLLSFLNPAVRNDDLAAPRAVAFQVYGLYFESALRDRKPVEARFAFDKMKVLSDPGRPEIDLSDARLLVLERKYDEAISVLTRLRASNPDMAQALVPDLAIAEASKGETDTAVRRLTELAGVRGPGQDMPLLREAVAMYFAAERPDDAIGMVRTRADQAPERIDLRHLLTETLLRAEQTEEALEMARSVAAASTDNALAQFTAGIAAAAFGEKQEALSFLEASLAIEPRSERTWLTLLGTSHGHDTYGHGSEASHDDVRALLDRAIDALPDSSDLRYELGLLALSEGKPEEAIAIFDAALVHFPAHLPSLTLGALARGDTRTDLDVAERYLQVAMALRSDDPVLMDVAGWVDLAQGETGPATTTLETALAMDPEDATIRYHLAVAYDAQARGDDALGQYLGALTGDLYAHYEEDARAGLIRLSPQTMLTVPVNRIDAAGIHEAVGEIVFSSMGSALHISGTVSGVLPGENGAHIHMRPTCAPGMGSDGPVAGGLAGAHFGHHDHGGMEVSGAETATDASAEVPGTMVMGVGTVMNHGAMDMEEMSSLKPRGDLPALVADDAGVATFDIMKLDLTLKEIRGRSIMIHAGPDGDDGTSGPKIACAVIP